MNYRALGDTGFNISEISIGTWQVGGRWGSGFDHKLADNILKAAWEEGINFVDTADVYENGESEKAVGRAVKKAGMEIFVATKCGRQISPHTNAGYTPSVLRQYVEDSLSRLGLERIDLIQLHCPPTEVYYRPEIFGEFERLREEGKIQYLGVSVEKVEEAIKAIEFSNVMTVQIIYNVFRQRPHEQFFQMASQRRKGIIVRVPLASGLLTGKFGPQSNFNEQDHRSFNRDGSAFDKGETFSGIRYDIGLEAVDRLKKLVPDGLSMAQLSLRWILMRPEVSCIIPGASKIAQVHENVKASDIPALDADLLRQIDEIYYDLVRPRVHQLW